MDDKEVARISARLQVIVGAVLLAQAVILAFIVETVVGWAAVIGFAVAGLIAMTSRARWMERVRAWMGWTT